MNDSTDHAVRNRLVLTGGETTNPLAQQVTQFNAWKKSIASEISRYRLWLNNHDHNVLLQQRLQEVLALFATERLRVVLVGEFSRGKTELINALLSQAVGARLFPTRVGRTTMCPVELFCDDKFSQYIKLLPIETRQQDKTLAEFRQQPDAWYQMDLDVSQPAQMQQVFREVARTREVQAEEAQRLGFDLDFLEASLSQPGYVHVPAWRHALINLHHPLLHMGLSIVDTPGMNAPGVEADLTTQVLPDAQAILYLLSVETGVTASDFSTWTQKIQPVAKAKHIPLFAILNKIDLLETDEESIIASADRLIRMTAQQLKIPRANVLPLSAKHGMKAYLEQDEVRLRRSGFAHLQRYLIPQILQIRQQLLENDVLPQIISNIQADHQQVGEKLQQLKREQQQLQSNQQEIQDDYQRSQHLIEHDQLELTQRSRKFEHGVVHVRSQLERVYGLVATSRLEAHVGRARSVLGMTPTSSTVASAVSVVISGVRLDLRRLRSDIENLPAQAKKLHDDIGFMGGVPELSIDLILHQIAQLEKDYAVSRSGAESPQEVFNQQFLPKLTSIYQGIATQLTAWGDAVVTTIEEGFADETHRLVVRRHGLSDTGHQMRDHEQRLRGVLGAIPDLEKDQQFLQELLYRLQAEEL